MNKYFYLLALLSCQSISAQTDFHFADSTAQWNVIARYNNGVIPVYYVASIYHVTGDTVIGGAKYQNIDGNYFRRDSFQRIYVRSRDTFPGDTGEYFIYDFGKNKGDTISGMGTAWCGAILCVVDSVDSVLIGHYRKRMYVTWIPHNFSKNQDVWIDGIGSVLDNFLAVPNTCASWEITYFELLCYFEQGQLLFHNNGSYSNFDCNHGVGLDDNIYKSIKATISPNPTTNHLTISLTAPANQSSTFQSLTFNLLDLTGKTIQQQNLTQQINHVDLINTSRGIYFYNIVSPNGKRQSGKLVIE